MIDKLAFNSAFADLLITLEKRRKKYLLGFFLSSIVALITLITSFYYAETFANSIFRSIASDTLASKTDVWSIRILGIILSIIITLRPIFKYRGVNQSAAIKTFRYHRFSLKDKAYSDLFNLFGSFEFAPRGEISPFHTEKSTLFPDHSVHLCEDLVLGNIHGIDIKFCEANLAEIENRERCSVFHGLLFVFDISETNLKLRKKFNGRAVIVHDPKKLSTEIAKRYSEMKRFPLPDAFEETLEAYTTDLTETQQIITQGFLKEIDILAKKLQATKRQMTHWDDRVAYAAESIYQSAKSCFLSLMPYANMKLPSEKEYDSKYTIGLDITKADPKSDKTIALHEHFELEYFDDKLIVTIPCPSDLYETDSLFSPALNQEDADLIYTIMQFVTFTASHLDNCRK